ncbi:MAG: LPD25 domain-containing protein, partial [Acutalibacteraceae bacterium]
MAYTKNNKNWIAENKEKLKNLQNQVKEIAENFVENPAKMIEFLQFKSKFYNYSVKNTMLIQKQLPGAVFCGSFQSWKEKGYFVTKGQTGLKIFVPVITTYFNDGTNDEWKRISDESKEEKEKIKKGEFKTRRIQNFKIGTVFDITQTNCPIEEYGKFIGAGYNSELHANIFKAVAEYSKEMLNCPVTFETTGAALRGYFSPADNRIAINEKLQDTQRLSTLTHELGHAFMHSSLGENKSGVQKELEADAFSIMLENTFGIEITEARKEHFVSHLKSLEEYNKSHTDLENPITIDTILQNVSQCYSDVIEDITHYIDKELSINKTITADLSTQEKNQPFVKILWSEHNNINDGAVMSIKTANDLLKTLDNEADDNLGYAKTKFQVFINDDIQYEGRYDIGVENCDLINHINDFCEKDLPLFKESGLATDEEITKHQSFIRNV